MIDTAYTHKIRRHLKRLARRLVRVLNQRGQRMGIRVGVTHSELGGKVWHARPVGTKAHVIRYVPSERPP